MEPGNYQGELELKHGVWEEVSLPEEAITK